MSFPSLAVWTKKKNFLQLFPPVTKGALAKRKPMHPRGLNRFGRSPPSVGCVTNLKPGTKTAAGCKLGKRVKQQRKQQKRTGSKIHAFKTPNLSSWREGKLLIAQVAQKELMWNGLQHLQAILWSTGRVVHHHHQGLAKAKWQWKLEIPFQDISRISNI